MLRQQSHAIRVLIGQALFSRIAGATELVALNWWVFSVTGSSTMVGVVTLARLVPLVFAGPRLGALADRMDAARLLSVILAVGSLQTVVVAVAMTLNQFWIVVALVALRSATTSAEPAIRNAILASISGRASLLKSMSSLSLILTLSLAVGPLLAGALMATGGPPLAVAVCGAGYALATATSFWLFRSTMWTSAAPQNPKSQFNSEPGTTGRSAASKSLWPSVRAEVIRNPRLGAQLILAVGPMLCVFPYTAMMPVLAQAACPDNAEQGIIWLSAASGVGSVLGAIALRHLSQVEPHVIAYVAAFFVAIPVLVLAATIHSSMVWVGLASIVMIGLVGQMYRTSNRAATLLLASTEHRGLISGISQTDRVLIPLGAFLFGVVADEFGVTAMAAAMSIGNVLLICPAAVLTLVWQKKKKQNRDTWDAETSKRRT